MKAGEVIDRLKAYFAGPAYCFLEQVADGTGAKQHRWADGVAMSVWPSRGYDIHGIEVKVSRYDWKKELEQPKKSEAVQQYCNRWWIATPDETTVEPGELPPTWGWMTTSGKGMRVVVAAPPLSPKPISIEFVASILRNVQRTDESALEAIRRAAENKGREDGRLYLREENARLKQAIEQFEQASGIEIGSYGGAKELGEAVRTLSQLKWRVQSIGSAIKACSDIQAMLEQVQVLAALDEAKKTETA